MVSEMEVALEVNGNGRPKPGWGQIEQPFNLQEFADCVWLVHVQGLSFVGISHMS